MKLAEKAESLDVILEHGGLAQPDARDIRVFDSANKPVSHLISFAETTRCRIIADAEAGPGDYAIYFGNLSPQLPPVPLGTTSAFGRKEWLPKGGLTCKSYDPMGPVDGRALLTMDNVLAYYERIIPIGAAAEKESAEKEKDPAKRRKCSAFGVYADANANIPVPDQWFHIFRAEINVPAAGKYDVVIGDAQRSDRFGVVFLDGERRKDLVKGWFIINFSPICVGVTGQVELKAGPHVLEMYTNRRNPEIRMGPAGATYRIPDYIGGLQAHYPDAKKAEAGEPEVQQGTLVEACRKAIGEWIAQSRFTVARSLCRYLKEKYASDAELAKQFDDEFRRVSASSYEKNWLTEGKYPARTGAVPDAQFAPPLKGVPLPLTLPLDDLTHSSSSLWVEGKHFYGLPFNIQELPWSVTSATSVEDGVLFVGTKNGALHAVDLSTGSERWSFQCGGPLLGAPLVYNGRVYFGTLDRRLYAVDVERGRMAWNFPANGWIEGGACAANGRVYFGSLDTNLYAIDAELGVQRWATSLNAKINATPATDGKNIYIGTRGGEFFAVDAADGKIVWTYSAGASITSGCCVGKDCVFFGDAAGKLHCVAIASGQSAWKQPCDIGGAIGAAPIMVGGAVYGGTLDGRLFGVEIDAGTIGWSELLPARGEIVRPPLFADNNLIFTSRQRGPYRAEIAKPANVSYQMGFPHLPCFQAAEEIVADGRLTEKSWSKALTLPLLKPNGFVSPEGGEVKLLWDAKTIHIAITCRDSDVVSVSGQKDADLSAGDVATITFDPRRDGLAAYQFAIAPSGTTSDALLLALGGDPAEAKNKAAIGALKLDATGAAWNPEWTGAVNVEGTLRSPEQPGADKDTGWTAEISIPIASLPKGVAPLPGHGAQWRMNVSLTKRDAAGAQTLSTLPSADEKASTAKWPVFQFLNDKVKP